MYTTRWWRLRRWLYLKGVPLPDRQGIEFEFHGDSVVWLWPWKRPSNKPILSIGFEAVFDSLYDLKLEWWTYDMYELDRAMKIQRQGHSWFFYGGYNAKSV